MQKPWIGLLVCGLLIIALAAGCSEDECASCPEAVTPHGYAFGPIFLTPGVTLPEMKVFGYGAVAPNLDSVKVGDSIVKKANWSLSETWEYSDAHWIIHFQETGDPSTLMYHHGDTASVTVWGEGRSSTCRVKVLNPGLAHPTITDPLPEQDTIAAGESDTIYWSDVDYVDYYAIMVAFYAFIDGNLTYFFYYDYAVDTFYIVSGAIQPDSLLHYNVHVTPFNGPNPRTGVGNWTGTLLTGKLFSSGVNGQTRIYIENPPDKRFSDTPENRPEYTADEIVRKVYEKYDSQNR